MASAFWNEAFFHILENSELNILLILVVFLHCIQVVVQVMHGFNRQGSRPVHSGPFRASWCWHSLFSWLDMQHVWIRFLSCSIPFPQIWMAFFLTAGVNVRQKQCFAGRLGNILAYIATVTEPEPCARRWEVGSEGGRNPVKSTLYQFACSLHTCVRPKNVHIRLTGVWEWMMCFCLQHPPPVTLIRTPMITDNRTVWSHPQLKQPGGTCNSYLLTSTATSLLLTLRGSTRKHHHPEIAAVNTPHLCTVKHTQTNWASEGGVSNTSSLFRAIVPNRVHHQRLQYCYSFTTGHFYQPHLHYSV